MKKIYYQTKMQISSNIGKYNLERERQMVVNIKEMNLD